VGEGCGEDELVHIPESWCNKLEMMEKAVVLLENLDVCNVNEKVLKGDEEVACPGEKEEGKTKPNRRMWGPTLVEKRPCRRPNDGRTMLEIAQERKKRANLEIGNKTSNPFSSLSVAEIATVADITKVKLGVGVKDKVESIGIVQECQIDRAKAFENSCNRCHPEIVVPVADDSGVIGEEDPKTPKVVICNTQGDELEESPGQWTKVAHRKKSKPRVY
jgi:hypothetical protein